MSFLLFFLVIVINTTFSMPQIAVVELKIEYLNNPIVWMLKSLSLVEI